MPAVSVLAQGAPASTGAPAAPASPESTMPQVTAPIAMMVDVNSGRVLFARDPHRRFVPASLTKIMTSYVAFELIKAGKLRLDQKFVMRPETFHKWHGVGSTMFLGNNSSTSVADLLEGIVTVSANDACVVLAEGIAGSVPGFTAMMNAEAKKIGMRDSHYNTPNGWMDQGETYVSAADLVALSTALITRHPDLYKRFYGHDHATFNGIAQENHNPLYGHTPGADGVKTGFTGEAGYGFVGSVERGGRRVIMVVAGYGRPNDRADQSRTFVEWAFSAWDSRPILTAGAKVGQAVVQGGSTRQVGLVTPRAYALAVPHGEAPRYTLSIRYKAPLTAPIVKGQEVASLIVRAPGQPIERLPLVTADGVAAGGAMDRLRDGFLAMTGRGLHP
ncbi:D-alanyl-D-alanine carboxypeptidase family protein [Novosphingobium nitrogenifigens]|uniref:D-alanyl-D-alanine carboxypeptidase family protein n=1 Tax=Novosphingobium nitrogenifigens TaxID=378548 RepID=UPI001E580AE7|nr:D-alanyl-D-alanine carboxypeptidase family protein [Novosphingobium nitrogenifigens]